MTSSTATRTVLLRSSWANVNIGDVAHSPGLLAALRSFDPQADLVLWPQRLGEREEAMIRRADPRVVVVRGSLGANGVPTTPELRAAWDRADVFVHGSGAGAFLDDLITAWREGTGKPYGYAGVTVDPLSPPTWGNLEALRTMTRALPPTYQVDPSRASLSNAEFVFTRDSISLEYLRGQLITPGSLEFGPDGTFAYTYRDEPAGAAFLRQHGLRPREFGCFVPRLRYTPYPDIYGLPMSREDYRRYAVNAGTVGPDLDVLAAAIAAFVRSTGQRAVVVPEMSYAVETARDELLPRIPADVVDRVIVHAEYWPLEQACAVYQQARIVVSMECHSPIMASVYGTPTLYLRQPTDTIKGEMYADLGAAELVVEIERDGPDGAHAAVDRVLADESHAREVSSAMNRVAAARLTDMAETILTGATPSSFSSPREVVSSAASR